MNLIAIARSIIPDATIRAYVLKGLRYLAALAAGAMIPLLMKWGFSANDATAVAAAVGTLIITAGGAAAGTILDGKSVGAQVAAAHAQGAVTAATAISAGAVRPEEITAASGTPAALAQLLAKLKAGQE